PIRAVSYRLLRCTPDLLVPSHGLLGDGRDYFHVFVLIGDLIIGDDIGWQPLLCMKRLTPNAPMQTPASNVLALLPKLFSSISSLELQNPRSANFPQDSGRRRR